LLNILMLRCPILFANCIKENSIASSWLVLCPRSRPSPTNRCSQNLHHIAHSKYLAMWTNRLSCQHLSWAVPQPAEIISLRG
jgi:hypothetical protein